jgi:iron uptake system component EfeO
MRSLLLDRGRTAVLVTAGLSAALALAGCGGGAQSGGGTAGAVAVTSTDDDCQVATTDLPAGTHVFRVENKGSRVTEFYVYGPGGTVVGEVEDISPGVSRELTVKLAAGTYEAACKPGMEGNGIRKTLTVSSS